jgi:hypothetical protein
LVIQVIQVKQSKQEYVSCASILLARPRKERSNANAVAGVWYQDIFTLPICWMLVHLSYYATLPNKIHPGAFCVFSEAKTATSSRNRAQALRMKPLQCWGAKGSSGRMRFLSLTAL